MSRQGGDESRARAMAAVQSVKERYWLIADKTGFRGHDSYVMTHALLLDASLGPPYTKLPSRPAEPPGVVASATFALRVAEELGNLNGVMHGGAYGVIFDMLTTQALAPVSRPGYWDFLGGVTRSLNMSYLRAVPVGTVIHVHAYLYQVGRTMAYIKGIMTSEDGEIVYALCEHHKVHVPTPKAHMEAKVPWDAQWKDRAETGPKL